jgi:hypothetical protein
MTMKVEAFKEILLRKTRDNNKLNALIKSLKNDLLADKIIESLESLSKMASSVGDNANLSLRNFAKEMNPKLEPEMMRDAIGHHVSRYKAAMNAGKNDLAHEHARQAFRVLHMAHRAHKHSIDETTGEPKLNVSYVGIQPWERHAKQNTYNESHEKVQANKYKPGEHVNQTKGLAYSQKNKSHDFLNKAPHESELHHLYTYENLGGHKSPEHAGKAYPFEQIKINDKYIPIDDDVKLKSWFEPHPFDHHPIMEKQKGLDNKPYFAGEMPPQHRSPEHDEQYMQKKEQYYNEDPHIDKWYSQHEELRAKDPAAYATRGSTPSKPVHENPETVGSESPIQGTSTSTSTGTSTATGKSGFTKKIPYDYIKVLKQYMTPEKFKEQLTDLNIDKNSIPDDVKNEFGIKDDEEMPPTSSTPETPPTTPTSETPPTAASASPINSEKHQRLAKEAKDILEGLNTGTLLPHSGAIIHKKKNVQNILGEILSFVRDGIYDPDLENKLNNAKKDIQDMRAKVYNLK